MDQNDNVGPKNRNKISAQNGRKKYLLLAKNSKIGKTKVGGRERRKSETRGSVHWAHNL